MEPDPLTITVRLLSAVAAGGAIGLERTYHGRPAGFRTHTLVCVTSAVLMLVTWYQAAWVPDISVETIRTDPTRIAQGILTGVGFLGAGVIHREGPTVRGLTTAGSIWLTAALGILYGIGFWYPAILGTVLALGILSAFRWLEAGLPSQSWVRARVRFSRGDAPSEDELRATLARHRFHVQRVAYTAVDDALEYELVLRTTRPDAMPTLAAAWAGQARIREFHLAPVGE
ncbi:MAG: MgtC/SapB family protein [Myxococcota bacterium]